MPPKRWKFTTGVGQNTRERVQASPNKMSVDYNLQRREPNSYHNLSKMDLYL